MAASAGSARQHKLFISSFGEGIYGFQSVPLETINETVINFLRINGFDASEGKLPQMGAAAGGFLEGASFLFKVTKGFISSCQKTVNWIEDKAGKERRKIFPSVALRIEVRETNRNVHRPDEIDYKIVKTIVSIIKEIDTILKEKYPIYNFSFSIASPKGELACFNIHFSENTISNRKIMKVIKKLSSRRAYDKCNIIMKNVWYWPFGRVVITDKDRADHKEGRHHENCHVPSYFVKMRYYGKKSVYNIPLASTANCPHDNRPPVNCIHAIDPLNNIPYRNNPGQPLG